MALPPFLLGTLDPENDSLRLEAGTLKDVVPVPTGLITAGGVPLVKAKYIDALTSVPLAQQDGFIGAPFSTIAQWLGAIPVATSAADAAIPQEALLSPASYAPGGTTTIGGTNAARVIELRSTGIEVPVTTNIAWANTGLGAQPQSAISVLSLHNVPIVGNITITDDGSFTGQSQLAISSDDSPTPARLLVGNIVATGAARLNNVFLLHAAIVGTITTATAGAVLPQVNANGCGFSASITTGLFNAFQCFFAFAPQTVTTGDGNVSTIVQTIFTQPVTLSNTPAAANAFYLFDGPSFASWKNAGGLVNTLKTSVLVLGGYGGGDAPGALLTDANVTVSFDGVGATAGFTNGGNHYVMGGAVMTASRTVTLSTHNASAPSGNLAPGDTMLIECQDTRGPTRLLTVVDAFSGSTLAVLGGSVSSVLVQVQGGGGFGVVNITRNLLATQILDNVASAGTATPAAWSVASVFFYGPVLGGSVTFSVSAAAFNTAALGESDTLNILIDGVVVASLTSFFPSTLSNYRVPFVFSKAVAQPAAGLHTVAVTWTGATVTTDNLARCSLSMLQ